MDTYTQVKMLKKTALAIIITVLVVHPAYAAGSGMPWEAPLQSILESISGPVAQILGTISIILTGLAMSLGESGGSFRKLLQIVFGLSIAFTATSFFLGFFSFTGGATF